MEIISGVDADVTTAVEAAKLAAAALEAAEALLEDFDLGLGKMARWALPPFLDFLGAEDTAVVLVGMSEEEMAVREAAGAMDSACAGALCAGFST